MTNKKNAFNSEVLHAVEEMKKFGYVPARFIQMLQKEQNNAHTVVQNLVMKDVTKGLEKLWEKGRLDLTMEAIIVKKEYQELFSPEIIKKCTDTLKKYGYKF